jgi:LPS export ABC transporter protein LptC
MTEDDAKQVASGRTWSLLVLLGFAIVAGACGEEPETPVAASELLELEADQAVFGMRMYITVEGVREALLYADTAYTYRDSVEIDVRSLRLTLYGETGNERAFVTAHRGAIDPNTQRMQARGNVVLTIPEQNRRIESEQLNYDPNRDRIWSDTATVMIHDGRRSTGDAFESDLGFTSVKIFGARGRSGNGGP